MLNTTDFHEIPCSCDNCCTGSLRIWLLAGMSYAVFIILCSNNNSMRSMWCQKVWTVLHLHIETVRYSHCNKFAVTLLWEIFHWSIVSRGKYASCSMVNTKGYISNRFNHYCNLIISQITFHASEQVQCLNSRLLVQQS